MLRLRDNPVQSQSYTPIERSLNKSPVRVELYQIDKTDCERLRQHVVDNANVYSQSLEMLAEAVVLLSEKSDTSITLYDFSQAWNALSKRIPAAFDKAKAEINLEQLLKVAIASHNVMTGKELALNTAEYALTQIGMPDDMIECIYRHQDLADQINLAQTSKRHLRAFQKRYAERLDSTRELTEPEKNMTPFLIYFKLPLSRQLRFFLDDEQGEACLAQLKIDGPTTRQRIRAEEFKTVADAKKSRVAVLTELIEMWDEIPLENQFTLNFILKWQDNDILIIPSSSDKPTIENLLEKGYANPFVKYFGDACTADESWKEKNEETDKTSSNLMNLKVMVLFNPKLQECFDRGLISNNKFLELDERKFHRLCLIYLGLTLTYEEESFYTEIDNSYVNCKKLIDRGFLSLEKILEMDDVKFKNLIYFFERHIEHGAMKMQEFLNLTPLQLNNLRESGI